MKYDKENLARLAKGLEIYKIKQTHLWRNIRLSA